MSLADMFHSIATGSRHRRALLTPVGVMIFGASLLLVVLIGLLIDRLSYVPALLPGAIGTAVGTPLLVAGLALAAWCVVRFKRARGTPVPFNPPTELVIEGPYVWTRNPMLTGVFTALFGVGVLLHSVGMVLISIPAYIVVHVIHLKMVEEPELERRFGTSYLEYKRHVPMFWPRFRRGVTRRAG